jgi:hypothetical protein
MAQDAIRLQEREVAPRVLQALPARDREVLGSFPCPGAGGAGSLDCDGLDQHAVPAHQVSREEKVFKTIAQSDET